ncbi:MAG: alpha/beta fold hydrolase [Candidatus Tectomicrobia bacterium]|nr:alpha/beta fold hydrolase [Candidatus Tectomicrobia bacterium]
MLSIKDETFDGTFPYTPHYHQALGVAMHYVDEGQGEPIVMLHGDPTWGYLYRRIIPPLATHYRCIVPDFMGMGKSDVPQTPFPYRLHHHIEHLEAVLLALDLDAMTLVLHDWGGPVGLGFTTRHPDRIKRLVLMNTWGVALWPGEPLGRILMLIRSKRGERFVLEKHGYLEPALVGTPHHPEHLTPTALRAYHAPFPTPESRLALLCWTRDIVLHRTDPSYAEMARVEAALDQFHATPVHLIWGMRDPVLPASVLHMWQRQYPQATTYEIAAAGHFLQEDAPEQVAHQIAMFIASHP